MSSVEITDSPQVQLIRSFCEGFKKRDMGHIANCLHKDHRRITYPRSLGKPEQTKEEYIKNTGEVMSLWIDSEPTVHSIIEAPGGKVVTHVCISGIQTNIAGANVVLQLTSWAKTSIGVDMNREMILIAHIVTDEDGSLKIKQLEEFTDSKAYLDFFKAITAEKAKREHDSSLVA